MTCDHAGCDTQATIRARFGDGTWQHGNDVRRQTFVYYCDPHLDLAAALFVLCDVGRITRKDEPNGPSRNHLHGRHPDLVARLTP